MLYATSHIRSGQTSSEMTIICGVHRPWYIEAGGRIYACVFCVMELRFNILCNFPHSENAALIGNYPHLGFAPTLRYWNRVIYIICIVNLRNVYHCNPHSQFTGSMGHNPHLRYAACINAVHRVPHSYCSELMGHGRLNAVHRVQHSQFTEFMGHDPHFRYALGVNAVHRVPHLLFTVLMGHYPCLRYALGLIVAHCVPHSHFTELMGHEPDLSCALRISAVHRVPHSHCTGLIRHYPCLRYVLGLTAVQRVPHSHFTVLIGHYPRLIYAVPFMLKATNPLLFTGGAVTTCKMRFHMLVMVLVFCRVTRALRISLTNKSITSVPQHINPLVTALNLDKNNIIRITNMSLALYKELRIFSIIANDLTYIGDGSFDHNPKLEKLLAKYNAIIQLPQSFGSAAKSLISVNFWNGFVRKKTKQPTFNFTEMERLDTLNMGENNFPGIFDAVILPFNLQSIQLSIAKITQVPEFNRYAPNLSVIALGNNAIVKISSKKLSELSNLKRLVLDDNELSTIPDLYHLPLEILKLSNNPLVCNQSLCWVRMWPWMKKTHLDTDDITCNTTKASQPVLLADVNPVTLGCHHGMYSWLPSYLKYKPLQIPKTKCVSSRLADVFTQSIEARC